MNQINATLEKETPEKTVTYLNINSIRLDGGTQQRTKLNLLHIQSLEDAIGEDSTKELEAIKVIFDGTDYWLVDGFHRYFAYKHSGRDLIPAIVDLGTQRDAILASVAANAENLALPRTRADKRKAIETLLKDPEWCLWSDNAIAKATKVHHTTVAAIRSSLANSQVTNQRKYTNKHGSVSTMRTSRIGGGGGGSSGGFQDGDYGSKQPAQISTNKTDYTHRSTIQPDVNDFTVRDGHIIPKSVLEETETQSNESSKFAPEIPSRLDREAIAEMENAEQLNPKPIQNDLKEWFLGFMSRFYEFPDSYILAIEQKIKERKEMEAMNL